MCPPWTLLQKTVAKHDPPNGVKQEKNIYRGHMIEQIQPGEGQRELSDYIEDGPHDDYSTRNTEDLVRKSEMEDCGGPVSVAILACR